jgi:hypothetical protein
MPVRSELPMITAKLVTSVLLGFLGIMGIWGAAYPDQQDRTLAKLLLVLAPSTVRERLTLRMSSTARRRPRLFSVRIRSFVILSGFVISTIWLFVWHGTF